MTVRWDAAAYERLADPQFAWALEVLEWRSWRGDERVLDAGCGPGRVAAALLERLPQGRVVALDQDPDMRAKAEARLSGDPRATVVAGDIGRLPFPLPLPHPWGSGAQGSADGRQAVGQQAVGGPADAVQDLPAWAQEPFDAVLSTAVLHWVPDHDAAFAAFHGLLRPGGELLLQCGGAGNIAALLEVAGRVQAVPRFAPSFHGWSPPWHFETAEATAARLQAAGFDSVEVSLQPRRPQFPGQAAFLGFCASAPLRPHLQQLDREAGAAFLSAVGDAWAEAGRPWELDYVRLNARARRPA